jgi:DoxX-like family
MAGPSSANPSQAPREASATRTAANPKWMFWTGWALTALTAVNLIVSAVFKFVQPEFILKELSKFGLPEDVVIPIGIVELVCTIIYLIPQTSVLGAILLTGYLGGATSTHVRIYDNFAAPVIVGVLVWLGLFLRDARLRALIPFRR